MKMKTNNKLIKLNFTGLLLVMMAVFICAANSVVWANSVSDAKKSQKLEKKMEQVSGSDYIDVIINPNGGCSQLERQRESARRKRHRNRHC